MPDATRLDEYTSLNSVKTLKNRFPDGDAPDIFRSDWNGSISPYRDVW